MVRRLSIVEEKRFWIAPNAARLVLTALRAESTEASAVLAPATVEMSMFYSEVPVSAEAVVPVEKPAVVGAVPPTRMLCAEVLLLDSVTVP